jgi:hypothetical protein
VQGKRDIKTTPKVKKRIKRLGISYDRVVTDWWDSFLATLWGGEDLVGKAHRREQLPNEALDKGAFRRTCCFSEAIESPESVCYGLFLHYLWLRLRAIIL